MTDLNKLSPAALAAAMRGGTGDWGSHGSADAHVRYAEPIGYRRKCRCGCNRWATHRGVANGVTLMSGCELTVRRWVRDALTPANTDLAHGHLRPRRDGE